MLEKIYKNSTGPLPMLYEQPKEWQVTMPCSHSTPHTRPPAQSVTKDPSTNRQRARGRAARQEQTPAAQDARSRAAPAKFPPCRSSPCRGGGWGRRRHWSGECQGACCPRNPRCLRARRREDGAVSGRSHLLRAGTHLRRARRQHTVEHRWRDYPGESACWTAWRCSRQAAARPQSQLRVAAARFTRGRRGHAGASLPPRDPRSVGSTSTSPCTPRAPPRAPRALRPARRARARPAPPRQQRSLPVRRPLPTLGTWQATRARQASTREEEGRRWSEGPGRGQHANRQTGRLRTTVLPSPS